jgi:dTMP kinase
MHRGKLIALEGIDGAGTTTQTSLLRDWLVTRGADVHQTREPTDGPAGSVVRLALSERLHLDHNVLALLFAADRRDHFIRDIEPKLKDGVWVVTDRYVMSSLAYQGPGSGVDWVTQINSTVPPPDLTILLDVPISIAMKRMHKERWEAEYFENLGGLDAVRESYRKIARRLALIEGQRVFLLNGGRRIDVVRDQIRSVVEPLLQGKPVPATLAQLEMQALGRSPVPAG